MQASTCFNSGCGNPSASKYKPTPKESLMYEEHKNEHLDSSLSASNLEPSCWTNCEAKKQAIFTYFINEGTQLEQLLLESLKRIEILFPSTYKFICWELKYFECLKKEKSQDSRDQLVFMVKKNQMMRQNLSFVSEVLRAELSSSDPSNDNFITQLLKIGNKNVDINAILGIEKAQLSSDSAMLALKSAARGYLARKMIKQERASQPIADPDIDLAGFYLDNLTIPRVLFENRRSQVTLPNNTKNITRLQSVARGYLAKKKLKEKEEAKQDPISDPISPSEPPNSTPNIIKLQSTEEECKVRQKEFVGLDQVSTESSSINANISELDEIKNISNTKNSALNESSAANNLQSICKMTTTSSETSDELSSTTASNSIKIIDGDFYTGERNSEGQKHGFGSHIFKNGGKYEGYWKNDKMSKGRYVDPNLTVYDGEWENDAYHGEGTLLKLGPDRNENNFETRYEGTFYGGLMHGYGTYTWKDRSSFKGTFFCDQMTGKGVFTDHNGVAYKVEWKDGKLMELD